MDISHFATDQTKFELEKGKHFLEVSFFWFGSSPYQKNQQYNTTESKNLLFVTTPSPLLPQPNTVLLKTSWKTQGWIHCILNQDWVWPLTSRKNWACAYFMYLKIKIQEAKAIPIQASVLCSKISILATFQTIKYICVGNGWLTLSLQMTVNFPVELQILIAIECTSKIFCWK